MQLYQIELNQEQLDILALILNQTKGDKEQTKVKEEILEKIKHDAMWHRFINPNK